MGLSKEALLEMDPHHPTLDDLTLIGLLAKLPKDQIQSVEELA